MLKWWKPWKLEKCTEEQNNQTLLFILSAPGYECGLQYIIKGGKCFLKKIYKCADRYSTEHKYDPANMKNKSLLEHCLQTKNEFIWQRKQQEFAWALADISCSFWFNLDFS